MQLDNYTDYGKEALLKVEEALNDIKNLYNQISLVKLAVRGKFSLPIGSIFALFGTYDGENAVKCDGKVLNKEEYLSFYNYAVTNKALLNTCTNDEFEQAVSANGYCEKFVIDEENQTVRIPLASGFKSALGDGFSPLYIVVKCDET